MLYKLKKEGHMELELVFNLKLSYTGRFITFFFNQLRTLPIFHRSFHLFASFCCLLYVFGFCVDYILYETPQLFFFFNVSMCLIDVTAYYGIVF